MATRWATTLGQQHGARSRAATLASQTARDAALERADLALSRWPRIVEAMNRLVSAYNEGFERETVSITEDQSTPSRPVVTVRAGGADPRSLVVTLEESMIYTRNDDAGNRSCETAHRLRPDRGDYATAAYILQHWMEQLSDHRI